MLYLVCRYAELVAQLEERERSTEATIQGLDKELALQQQANESHRKRAEDGIQELSQLQLQVAEKQKLLDSAEQTLSSRTDECEKETQLYRRWALYRTYGLVSESVCVGVWRRWQG